MKIVYAYVVADLLHYGHVRHLRRARALGDLLIVGVLTQLAVREKKPAPVQMGYHRMEVIRALRCVDQLRWQSRYSPLDNVKILRPDIVAESEDHVGNDYMGDLEDFVKSYGGKVVFLPYTREISTTRIKEKVISQSMASGKKTRRIDEGGSPGFADPAKTLRM